MPLPLFSRIRLHSNRFTQAHERIVNYIKDHVQEVIHLPINELAERCQVGDATVIRFYRLLGYENYHTFQIAMAKELIEDDVQPIYEEVENHDLFPDVTRKVIASTVQGITDLAGQISPAAIHDITAHLRAASVIHVIGLGASGIVAQDVMHKLMRLGLKINAYTDSHLMTIAASIAQPEEVFFAISHSGETTDILRTLELAKNQGCYTCAMTSYSESNITRLVPAYLLTCTRDTKMRSDTMISRIVQLVVVDILYVMLALQIGEAASERVTQSRLALKQYRDVNR
ncbi:MurR/RpiR family transcriptional regulator [Sporomusa silvacetica]|uniref:MurR/RpiR family transcriptional regulator n=1 Tax=Sporomusa silvacetica TaxID=55504 RepID=UPI001FE9CC0B|nr:MurR/RpiR family transcriptional regulator [Sporomusa silvacetica]